MSCRELLDVSDRVIARLAGELPREAEADLERHLEGCAECRAQAAALAESWERLAEDPDPVPSRRFARETLERMEEATVARRLVRFPSRRSWAPLLSRAAALAVAAAGGFLAARLSSTPAPLASPQGAPSFAVVPVGTERTLDASRTVPDLSARPRLDNVVYLPSDPSGRIGVSFDVTTRYTVVGRPEDRGLSGLLPHLVSEAGTEGARGRALDLVSQSVAAGAAASPEVVSALVETLRTDRNPGVRKKAAEALSQLPPSREVREALVETLKKEPNPGIRIVAVEGLSRAASELKDPSAIETLRELSSDRNENGYVRVKAASALAGLTL